MASLLTHKLADSQTYQLYFLLVTIITQTKLFFCFCGRIPWKHRLQQFRGVAGRHITADAVTSANFPVELAAGAQMAGLGFWLHANEAKSLRPAAIPFKIID